MNYEQQMKMAAAQREAMRNVYPEQVACLGQANTISSRPMSPVECEMQGLSEMLGTLHKRFSVLEERLRPILHGQIDKPSPAEIPVPTTSTGVPFADHLRSMFETATVLRNRLDDVTERLAL
jgi:hypothetical protein